MIQNRRFALAYRAGACLFAVAGLLKQIGVFSGTVSFRTFMYYTIQSNLLAVTLFAYLAVKTAGSLREGAYGNAGWRPRLGMVCAVNVFLTFVVFWALLVPQGITSEYLLSFENLAVHAVTPLLCLFDYILFAPAGRLKYRDVYYVCLFPLLYVVFTSAAGLAGYVYRYEGVLSGPFSSHIDIVPIRFPYFFLDFDKLGMAVFVYIGGIMVFFLLLGHGIYFIDRNIRKNPAVSPPGEPPE
ncbi:MAG: Pr6Pr family membrane protein [Oscillospiraceae bacterium]|nr:Pr6Pr family membrane protein [Oscillospiraceae bacterium]